MDLKRWFQQHKAKQKEKAGNSTSLITRPVQGGYTWTAPKPCNVEHSRPLMLDGGRLFGLSGKMAHEWRAGLDLNVWLADTYCPEDLFFRNITAPPVEGPEEIFLSVRDRHVPTVENMKLLLEYIRAKLAAGKAVSVSCHGGHGRTGTIISIVYGSYHPEDGDPAQTVRSVLCNRMVETTEQEQFIYDFLERPYSARVAEEIRIEQKRKESYKHGSSGGQGYSGGAYYSGGGFVSNYGNDSGGSLARREESSVPRANVWTY